MLFLWASGRLGSTEEVALGPQTYVMGSCVITTFCGSTWVKTTLGHPHYFHLVKLGHGHLENS
jgi:hypothetical protein